MKERRRSVRQSSNLRGRVSFNQGDSLPCIIRDISYEGARIDLRKSIDIPKVINVHIPSRKSMIHAIVRWQRGNRIGVSLF
jgi:hypothetical protein